MKPQWEHHSASLAEFANLKASSTANYATWDRTTLQSDSEHWLGIAGGRDAVKRVFQTGWTQGVERTLAALKGLQVRRAVSIRRKRTRGEFGDAVDMQRVYRGDLATAWERMQKREGVGSPIKTLYVRFNNLGGTGADTFFWRGAAALIVADALTAAGYSVQIIAGMGNTHVSSKIVGLAWHTVEIKASTAPLDLHTLAGTVALAGFFRVIGFGAMSAMPGAVDMSFGRSVEVPADVVAGRFPGALILGDVIDSQASAQNWIDATLAPFAG